MDEEPLTGGYKIASTAFLPLPPSIFHDSLQGAIDDDDTCASISELNFSLTSRDDAWRPMALLSTPKAKANEDSTQGKPRHLS